MTADNMAGAPSPKATSSAGMTPITSPQFVIEKRQSIPEWKRCDVGCSNRTRIVALFGEDGGRSNLGKIVTVCGWSRTVRKQGGGSLCFVALSDGSCVKPLQVVVNKDAVPEDIYAVLLKCGIGCSFKFVGLVTESPAAGQTVELQIQDKEVHSVHIYGTCDAAVYPLSKKQHSKEFLRTIAHLRPRTNVFGCITRMRSSLSMATHRFFQDLGFLYVHTPLITTSDCEGAGEMFQVTTLIPDDGKFGGIPVEAKNKEVINFAKDFFGKRAYLTVSGQLDVEAFCCSMCDVYTFGPTFRAELSHTYRHLAEFWMIEPEIAFADLEDVMRCAEAYLKYCVEWALLHNKEDVEWCDQNIEPGLKTRLENVVEEPFARISYTDAIEVLKQQPEDRFETKVTEWGIDLASEHERFLAEDLFKKPVIVYNYPKDIKSFYMKLNEDGKTVRAMDMLLPKIGEVIGGSQREEDFDKLEAQIKAKGLALDNYWWYNELRKYGTVPHSGFGLGFERLLMMLTGVENIRDVIPFPRYPGSAEF